MRENRGHVDLQLLQSAVNTGAVNTLSRWHTDCDGVLVWNWVWIPYIIKKWNYILKLAVSLMFTLHCIPLISLIHHDDHYRVLLYQVVIKQWHMWWSTLCQHCSLAVAFHLRNYQMMNSAFKKVILVKSFVLKWILAMERILSLLWTDNSLRK